MWSRCSSRQLVHAVAVQRRPPARRTSSSCRRSARRRCRSRAITCDVVLDVLADLQDADASSSSGFSSAERPLAAGSAARRCRASRSDRLPPAHVAERDVARRARRRAPARCRRVSARTASSEVVSVSMATKPASVARGDPAVQRRLVLHQLVGRRSTGRPVAGRCRRALPPAAAPPIGCAADTLTPPRLAARAMTERKCVLLQERQQPFAVGLAAWRSRRAAPASGTSSFSRTSSRQMRACSAFCQQRLAALRLLDLAGAREQRLEIAVSLDQLAPRSSRRCPARPARCRWNRRPAPARRSPCPAPTPNFSFTSSGADRLVLHRVEHARRPGGSAASGPCRRRRW